jgi:hypothetical protein
MFAVQAKSEGSPTSRLTASPAAAGCAPIELQHRRALALARRVGVHFSDVPVGLGEMLKFLRDALRRNLLIERRSMMKNKIPMSSRLNKRS